MSDRLAEIKAALRNQKLIDRGGMVVYADVRWLASEVERLRTHEYHWRIEVQALRDRVAELTRFNLDAGSEVRRLRGLCHDGTHQCACQGVATTVSGTLEMLAALRQRHEVAGACEHCDHRLAELTALRQRHAAAVAALTSIASHPHISYDHPSNAFGGGSYGTGCADGHRCAASIAKAALERDHDPQ